MGRGDDDETAASQSFGRTTAVVLDHIVLGLSNGRYEPGQKLNAASLCRELGLSKAPVREALHVLAGEGVLDLSTNRGAFICALDRSDLIKLWEAFAVVYGHELRVGRRRRRSGPARLLKLGASAMAADPRRSRQAPASFGHCTTSTPS